MVADETIVAVAGVAVAVRVLLVAHMVVGWLHVLLIVHDQLASGCCNSCKIGFTRFREV